MESASLGAERQRSPAAAWKSERGKNGNAGPEAPVSCPCNQGSIAMWKKVVAPTALVSVLWLLATCGTSYMLEQLDANQTRLLNCSRNVIQAAGAMQENLWRLQALLLEAAEHLERGRDLRERFRIEAKQIEGAFERSLVRARDNASTAAEFEFVRNIGNNFAQYRSMSHERFARINASPAEAAEAVDAAMRLALAVAQPCERLSELSQSMTTEAFQRRDRLRTKVDWARFGFVIFGPAIGILLGLRSARACIIQFPKSASHCAAPAAIWNRKSVW